MVPVKADRDSEAGVMPSKFPPEEVAREQAMRDELQKRSAKP